MGWAAFLVKRMKVVVSSLIVRNRRYGDPRGVTSTSHDVSSDPLPSTTMSGFKGRMTELSPSSPIDEQPVIGIIGMGKMGHMYAKHLSAGGWKK